LAIDLPGFGASPPPSSVWGSPEYAQLVTRVVEEVVSDSGSSSPLPMVVLGHSFGGRVAVHLAASRPDLVRALVLSGAPLARREGAGRRAPAGFRVVRALRRAHVVPETTLERARRRYGSADYVAAEGVMRQVLVRLLSERYDDQLSRIGCPVELVWGDDDTEAPLWIAENVASVVTGAKLTVCAGAGHLTPLSAPMDLRRAVDRLLGATCTITPG
jgi:pimeloyl-ACP methyl ester carboxylesterase